jgi:hypothetical protein
LPVFGAIFPRRYPRESLPDAEVSGLCPAAWYSRQEEYLGQKKKVPAMVRGVRACGSRAGRAERISAMKKRTIRVITRGSNGELRIRDYDSPEELLKRHLQIGVDDCNTDLSLRGLPVLRGLIGPIPDGPNFIRYESPEVFEAATKDWVTTKPAKRRRRRGHTAQNS